MGKQPQLSPNNSRLVTRPFSKLERLCAETASGGGKLTNQAAVAEALGVSQARVSQIFGRNQERDGYHIQAETIGKLARVFTTDGVRCEIHWLYLEFEAFEKRLAESRSGKSSTWERHERSALSDLVELRVNPPLPGNEVPDSYYVDATLLFGIAEYEHLEGDGQVPRTFSIALRDAKLSIDPGSYSPLPGTLLGDRVESEYFNRVAGGLEIVGPTQDGMLQGAPFDDHYLAVVAGTNSGDDPFQLTVVASTRSFVVTDLDALPGSANANTLSGNKNMILNALISKDLGRYGASGRPVLARATLKRRSRVSGFEQ